MNKKNTLSNIKKVNEIDTALKHLCSTTDGTYISCFLDGNPVLCGVIQMNNGTEFTNDLSEKVPNGEITRGELIGNIFDTAIILAWSEEEYRQQVIQDLAELYAMENGADHDRWFLVFNQVSSQCIEDLSVSQAEVELNRAENKIFVRVQMIQSNSIFLSFSLEATLDTYTIVSIEPLSSESALFLNTENEFEYTPTEDYHPATKKYVDDKCAELDNDSALKKVEYFYVGRDNNNYNLYNSDSYTLIKVYDDFNNLLLKDNENYKRENNTLIFNYKTIQKIKVEYY